MAKYNSTKLTVNKTSRNYLRCIFFLFWLGNRNITNELCSGERLFICLQEAKHWPGKPQLKELNPILGYFNTDFFFLGNQLCMHVEEPDKSNVSRVEKG